MCPETALTVSWEVSRLRAGRQGPWGALGRPPLQAAPWGTAALWLRMEVGWRWTRSRTQGSMIWDSSSSRSEKVPVASGGPREHPSKGSTCSSRKSLSGSGVGSLRRTLAARAVLGQRDSSGWCGVLGADSPRAEPRLPQSRVCGSRETERRWLLLPQGAPGPACTCVPVCVCVLCMHTCGDWDEARLRRAVNTPRHLRTTADSKGGADSANRRRTGADVRPDPGGRDGPLRCRPVSPAEQGALLGLLWVVMECLGRRGSLRPMLEGLGRVQPLPADPGCSDCLQDAPAPAFCLSHLFGFSGTAPMSAVSVPSENPLADPAPCQHEAESPGSLAGPLRGGQLGEPSAGTLEDGE